MRRLWFVVGFGGAITCAAFACSLDESGQALGDATTDVQPDIVITGDACSPCATLLNSGWQLVALQANGTACPSGFSLEFAAEDVDAGPGLCDCACQENAGGCSHGTLNIGYLANCGTPAQVKVDGGCEVNNGTLWPGGFQASFVPSSLTPCTPQIVVNDAAITATQNAVCHPPSTCDESLCNGSTASGYSACIVHADDVSCPSGPFTQKHLVGQPSATCSACACSCSGTFAYYYDNACDAGAMVIDASCTATSNPNASVASDKWTSTGCVAAGLRDGSVSLTNTRTICCR